MSSFNASEKYYYCSGCNKFHKYGSHNVSADRKLCFFCGKVQDKKTKIIGNSEIGHTQVCSECEIRNFGLTNLK